MTHKELEAKIELKKAEIMDIKLDIEANSNKINSNHAKIAELETENKRIEVNEALKRANKGDAVKITNNLDEMDNINNENQNIRYKIENQIAGIQVLEDELAELTSKIKYSLHLEQINEMQNIIEAIISKEDEIFEILSLINIFEEKKSNYVTNIDVNMSSRISLLRYNSIKSSLKYMLNDGGIKDSSSNKYIDVNDFKQYLNSCFELISKEKEYLKNL